MQLGVMTIGHGFDDLGVILSCNALGTALA
jgi:hypothetical protein